MALCGVLAAGSGAVGALHRLAQHDDHAGEHSTENCAVCHMVAASAQATVDLPELPCFDKPETDGPIVRSEFCLPVSHVLGPPVERGPPTS